jgi:hypothetical protein
MPGSHNTIDVIHIADAAGKIVCTLPRDEFRLADMIVRKINKTMPLRYRLFGPPRDQKQKDYDKWIATSSGSFDFARANLEYMEHKAGRK